MYFLYEKPFDKTIVLLMLVHDMLKQMQILVALVSFEKSKIIYIFQA